MKIVRNVVRSSEYLLGLPEGSLAGSNGENYLIINFIFRKIVHFIVYTGLALLSYLALARLKPGKRVGIRLVFTFCVLCAVLDEFHQAFIPGRTPRLADVLIDSMGVGLGIIIGGLVKKTPNPMPGGDPR